MKKLFLEFTALSPIETYSCLLLAFSSPACLWRPSELQWQQNVEVKQTRASKSAGLTSLCCAPPLHECCATSFDPLNKLTVD